MPLWNVQSFFFQSFSLIKSFLNEKWNLINFQNILSKLHCVSIHSDGCLSYDIYLFPLEMCKFIFEFQKFTPLSLLSCFFFLFWHFTKSKINRFKRFNIRKKNNTISNYLISAVIYQRGAGDFSARLQQPWALHPLPGGESPTQNACDPSTWVRSWFWLQPGLPLITHLRAPNHFMLRMNIPYLCQSSSSPPPQLEMTSALSRLTLKEMASLLTKSLETRFHPYCSFISSTFLI